ncbi:MAG TPA: UDP-glucose 4-epimerase GalE [Tenuifilaceae bacterium]|nr:UDP-glucose 4-epimerase GalE [Tenuifilaceae bacterium]
MSKILLTGGTGYIGSHTAVELISAGFEVVIVDNLSNSSADVLNGIERITGVKPEFVKADCADMESMVRLFNRYPDICSVIHFAALKAVGESVEKPLQYYQNNITSLLNLLFLLNERCAASNFVFSSSCTVYGQPDNLPVTELSPYKPASSPYGNTKKIAEDILRDSVHASKSLKVVALRYFNPIGAHPSAEIGELPQGKPDNLVPFITQTAAGVRDKLMIFGNDYNTPDGTAIRDYFHVVDLAKAHVIALQRMIEGKSKQNFEVFNVGAGKGITVLEIVETFKRVTGTKLNYEFIGRREGDIEKVWADTSLANNELGWNPENSLGEALLSAWRWEKKIRNIL